MFVCPVCEHAQAGGSECELCGRAFQEAPDPGPEISALDGLEPTFQPAAGAVPGEAVPGLEKTSADPVEAPPAQDVPDLESTRTAPVEVQVAALSDVERHGDGVPADERTPYPALVTCRYCRTEAAPGERICSRCGMKLPTADPPAAAVPAEEAARICSCGTPIRGSRCPSCGARTE